MATIETVPRPALTPRAAALRWAAEVAADRSAVFLDTETSGLGDDAEICDLAIVAVDGAILFDQLIRPWRGIPEAATQVHGITEAMVLDAPYWEDVAVTIRSILHGRRTVVYNAAYDSGVVNGLCGPCRLPSVPGFAQGWECAMQAYAAFYGKRRFGGGFTWFKLGHACAQLGIVLDGAHRALQDADACRRLVLTMAEVTR